MPPRTPPSPPRLSDLDAGTVSVRSKRRVYDGYAKVDEYEFSHPMFLGGQSPIVKREIFLSGDAVMVIPFDVHHQTVLLIEQFRMGPLHRGDHPWIFEGIAGRIESGEEPVDVARREAVEEAGVTLGTIEQMGGFFLSPGIIGEHMTFFCASADLSDAGGIHGLDTEDEDIRAVVAGLDDALQLIDDGALVSAPTGLALLWLARHRDRLTTLWHKG